MRANKNACKRLLTNRLWHPQGCDYCTVSAAYSNYRRFTYRVVKDRHSKHTVLILTLLLTGDIEENSSPSTTSVYLCGLWKHTVTWHCRGVACDDCGVWYHGSCIELCSNDFAMLERSNVQWLCHKCDSINNDTFTFRSLLLNCSNYYTSLTDPDITSNSVTSSFSPLKTRYISQPEMRKSSRPNSSTVYHVPEKKTTRILTVNCQNSRTRDLNLKQP